MNINGMSDDQKNAHLEMMGAVPGLMKVAARTAEIVENALAPVLEDQPRYSCLHAVDETWRTPLGGEMATSRTAFLGTRHPEQLLCDGPADRHGPGCAIEHMRTERSRRGARARLRLLAAHRGDAADARLRQGAAPPAADGLHDSRPGLSVPRHSADAAHHLPVPAARTDVRRREAVGHPLAGA